MTVEITGVVEHTVEVTGPSETTVVELGVRGTPGVQGEVGPQGLTGDTGAQGIPGVPGIELVHHHDDPSVPRPDAPVVYWLGVADPENAEAWDLQVQENI